MLQKNFGGGVFFAHPKLRFGDPMFWAVSLLMRVFHYPRRNADIDAAC